MNEDYYHEQNSCYDSNSFGFDQFQPPQYTVNHPISNVQNSLFNAQNSFLNSQNKLMEQMTSMCDMVGQYMQKKEEEKRIAEEQAAKDRYWKIPVCYDDDDDEKVSIHLKDIISELPPCVAITPDSPKSNSLIMEDEHLDTIPETESDELIKSSVEDLSKSQIDSLLDEFTGELTLPHSIPPGIDDVNLDPEGDILFLESLLYDNSYPRLPEEFNSENPTKSFSPSLIPVEE
ncbi:hypothetical protein Tco_1369997 [Tanacetum coccineum]